MVRLGIHSNTTKPRSNLGLDFLKIKRRRLTNLPGNFIVKMGIAQSLAKKVTRVSNMTIVKERTTTPLEDILNEGLARRTADNKFKKRWATVQEQKKKKSVKIVKEEEQPQPQRRNARQWTSAFWLPNHTRQTTASPPLMNTAPVSPNLSPVMTRDNLHSRDQLPSQTPFHKFNEIFKHASTMPTSQAQSARVSPSQTPQTSFERGRSPGVPRYATYSCSPTQTRSAAESPNLEMNNSMTPSEISYPMRPKAYKYVKIPKQPYGRHSPTNETIKTYQKFTDIVVKRKTSQPADIPLKQAKWQRNSYRKTKAYSNPTSPRVQTTQTLYEEKIMPLINRVRNSASPEPERVLKPPSLGRLLGNIGTKNPLK